MTESQSRLVGTAAVGVVARLCVAGVIRVRIEDCFHCPSAWNLLSAVCCEMALGRVLEVCGKRVRKLPSVYTPAVSAVSPSTEQTKQTGSFGRLT